MEYKYQLQRYTGRSSRHICPKCGKRSFTLYIDAAGETINENVGRCDHESSCGYHLTPKQFFETHPAEKDRFSFDTPIKAKPQPKRVDHIPFDMILRSRNLNNTLMDHLKKYWSEKELQAVMNLYHLGSTHDKGIIFPQIDEKGRCRTGKIMFYDKNGHRIKQEQDRITWLHTRYSRQAKKAFNFEQCLFGQHLLKERPEATVCIVEGEKTAVICSLVFPGFIWLSCGGKKMFTPERLKILSGRNVIVYPDAEAVDEWSEKMGNMTFCKSIKMSRLWKDEPDGSKRDIADLIMEERRPIEQATTIGQLCQWLHESGVEPGQVTFNI